MSSSMRGVGGSGGSGYDNYNNSEDLPAPSNQRSNRQRRGTTSQYGSSLRPDNMPPARPTPQASTSTSTRTRSTRAPAQSQSVGGSSSSPDPRLLERAGRFAARMESGRPRGEDSEIDRQIQRFRTSGQPAEHPVARAIIQHAAQFHEPSTRGPTSERTHALSDAMADLRGEDVEAPSRSTRSSQSSRIAPPPVRTDDHLRVAGALDRHLFGQGEVDPATESLIGEMMDFEVNGTRPPAGSPMRPIADIMHHGLSPESTHVERQNVMFIALSETLGVRPGDVLGAPDPATGLPSNARYLVRETSAMAGWMSEVAMRGADPATRRAAEQVNRFIETGEIPPYGRMDEETARIIEVASRETSPAGTPRGSPRRSPPSELGSVGMRRTGADTLSVGAAEGEDAPMARRNAVTRALLHVMNNEGEGTIARGTYSTANSIGRNLFTVMAPTMLRQYLDQGIASGTANWSEHHQLGMALTAALIPPMLLGIGAYVDRDQATTASNVSRATLALVSFGAMAAALATGNMASLGPSLMGFLAYAAMRDLGQKFIKLDNPDANPDMRLGTTLKGAGAYIPNQTIASALMTYLASPSGAGAAGMPFQALNGFLRGVINMGAETGDDVTYNTFASREAGQSLRLTLSGAIPSPRELLSTYTTTSPSRATLSTVDAMLSAVVGSALANTNLSSTAQTNLNNFFGAAVLGVLYSAFLHIHQGPPEAASVHDTEGGGAPRIRVSGDGGGESFGMDRLSIDGRSTRSTPSRHQGFTGNVGLGGGSNRSTPLPSREASIRGLPPTPRDSRTHSRSSSMAGLPPSQYESRASSVTGFPPLPQGDPLFDGGRDPRDNAFLAPPPFGDRFSGAPVDQHRYPPPQLRVRDQAPIRQPVFIPPRDPSIQSRDSDSTEYHSFSTEFYTPPDGSIRSNRSRRRDDDDDQNF